MGGGFNQLIQPDQADIAKNTVKFLTWWTPGQYLIPWGFKFMGFNTGQAAAITITLCQLLGLSGFYAFFKKLGFNPLIVSLSMAFIACQQFYALNYIFYNGGGILLFGFTGWFLYGCAGMQKPGLRLLLFVLLSGVVGFFCKSSILWIYVAGLLVMWLRLSQAKRSVGNYIKNGIWIAIPALISLVVIYLFFISQGRNPASASGHLKLTWQTFCFPTASPLLAGLSVDDLAHGLLFHQGVPVFGHSTAIIIIVLAALISIMLVLAILRFVPNNNYRLFLLVFYLLSVLFFSYAYLQQMAISYEARHYRVIGILIIPGIFTLLGRLKPAYWLLFALVWIGIGWSSFHYLAKGYQFNRSKSVRGTSGFAQQFIDWPSLYYVMTLDNKSHNAIFAFTSNDIGLEIRHNRIINLEQIPDYDHVDLEDYEYDGHAGPLYILLPVSYQGKKADTILKFFPGYKDFVKIKLSERYVLYSAK